MKPVLSVLFIFILIMVAVHCSSIHTGRINKRYYDTFDSNNDERESVKGIVSHHKNDPCENKPLWFLKSQRKLGKLSPYYSCLNDLASE